MKLSSFLVSTLLVLSSNKFAIVASSEGEGSALGLFVMTTYEKWIDGTTREKCDATDCARTGCSPKQLIFVEESCSRRLIKMVQNETGAQSLHYLNNTHLCLKYWKDNDCKEEDLIYAKNVTVDKEPAATLQCNVIHPLSSCSDDDVDQELERTEYEYISDYCQETEQASADFPVPIIERFGYLSAETCAATDVNNRVNSFALDNPSYCRQQVGSSTTDGGYVVGSEVQYCDDDGNYVVQRYSDSDCSESIGHNLPIVDTTKDDGSCSHLTDGKEVTAEDEDQGLLVASCNTPRYHCRDMVVPALHVTNLDEELMIDNETTSSEDSLSAAPARSPTMVSVLVLVLAQLGLRW